MVKDYFLNTWQGLNWTDWVSLKADSKTFKQIPTDPGVYRIKAAELGHLVYIGQTGRNLRERIGDLKRYIYGDQMPFNDPHTAAPNLWCWFKEEKYQYSCSAAAVSMTKQERQVLEDKLLWKHRIESGASTLCNYGRFHPQYTKSKDRSKGYRGSKLPNGKLNPAGGPCTKPLQEKDLAEHQTWMGLSWSPLYQITGANLNQIPKTKGLYKVLNLSNNKLLYVGETKNLRNRIYAHTKKDWGSPAGVSFYILPDDMLGYQRHELEVDLIGCYYSATGIPPKFQYRNSSHRGNNGRSNFYEHS